MYLAEPFKAINPARRRPNSLKRAESIDDLRELARARLPNFSFEYLEGGAEGETTLRRNRDVFQKFPFSPRMAVDVSVRDLSCEVFGKTIGMPIVVAPTGGNSLLWPKGDRLLAEAAAEFGIPMAQSTVSMMRVEGVASVPGLRHWFQLYPFGGEQVARRLIEQALGAGSEALVITTDGAISGNREWDRRNYQSPNKLAIRSKLDIARHPDWLFRNIVLPGLPNFENITPFVDQPENPTMFDVGRWLARNNPTITWDFIKQVRSLWPRKLVLKGLLRVDDVLKAADLGVDGVVLSNHGGRQCEPTISPLEILHEVRQAVGDDFTVLIDSGFRRGTEVATALALGADAVMVGRATLYGLAAGGKEGVLKALSILRTELDRTLALTGVPSARELSLDALACSRSSTLSAKVAKLPESMPLAPHVSGLDFTR
ncbi:alpha-hydroxy acid oxidase [Burkholderia multivorans]|uniref:alpha-hydroxy acid oxidase n=1 Tax=Burkholderia multivorans TaxID=87883 RepID=UPI002ED385F2|nr:alpha-hydroxy acid oxidase [Burkholderia multivorans]